MRVAPLLHIVSAVIWGGGIFQRFFRWVWAAAAPLLVNGSSMMGEMARVPAYVQAMSGVGILMIAIFTHVYVAPFGRLKRAVAVLGPGTH